MRVLREEVRVGWRWMEVNGGGWEETRVEKGVLIAMRRANEPLEEKGNAGGRNALAARSIAMQKTWRLHALWPCGLLKLEDMRYFCILVAEMLRFHLIYLHSYTHST